MIYVQIGGGAEEGLRGVASSMSQGAPVTCTPTPVTPTVPQSRWVWYPTGTRRVGCSLEKGGGGGRG